MVRRSQTGEWTLADSDIKRFGLTLSILGTLLTAVVGATVAWISAASRVAAVETRVATTEARLTSVEAGLRDLSADVTEIRVSVQALVRFRCLDSDEQQQRLAGIYADCQAQLPPRRRGQ
jgi:hypothetical protein